MASTACTPWTNTRLAPSLKLSYEKHELFQSLAAYKLATLISWYVSLICVVQNVKDLTVNIPLLLDGWRTSAEAKLGSLVGIYVGKT